MSEIININSEAFKTIMENFNLMMETYQGLKKMFERFEKEMTCKEDGAIWVDESEVCRLLNVSGRTMYRRRKEGEIAGRRIHNHIYYRLKDIQIMMERGLLKKVTKENFNEFVIKQRKKWQTPNYRTF